MVFPLIFPLRTELDLKAIDAAFAAAYAESKTPVVAAAIVKDGHTVWIKAAGEKAAPDAKFRIASLTKAFTATLVLQLVKEKKIALDDPIGKTLPTLPVAWRSATIRQLLNHTSGIPSGTDQPDFIAKIGLAQTPEQIVAQTADKPLDFPIGSRFHYDNTGYVLLGMIVEKVDKGHFGRSLQRRILKPLGMSNTEFDSGNAKGVLPGFTEGGKPAIYIHMSQPYSAGSIVSTAADMAKWLAAQNSEKLLPKALWNEVWTPGKLSDGKTTGYGFGWQKGDQNGIATQEHSGGIPGFHTFARLVPSLNLSVVVLMNSDVAEPAKMADQLLGSADPTLKASDVAILDPDPKVTESAAKLLKSLAEGQADKSLLTKEMADHLTPEVEKQLQDFLSGLGEVQEMRLVKLASGGRTYLVRYEKKNVRAWVASDAEGKLSGFSIQPR